MSVVNIDRYWYKKLAKNDKTDATLKSIENFCTILENKYNGKIFLNDLAQEIYLLKDGKKQEIETVDYDELQMEIERDYGIYDVKKFSSALRIVSKNHVYNPIKEYLESLKWDGISRTATILEEYLGTNPKERNYNQMCLKLFLFGAIERTYNPGAKFDFMLIINGAQGIGKSSFFKIMCGENFDFYQEHFDSFEKSFEYTKGKWIVELGELNAFSKADLNYLKDYITLTKETYRIPYEIKAKDYLRRYVLLGTTNEQNFIPDDPSGERRWIVIEAANDSTKKNITKKMFSSEGKYEIQQVLAEVFEEYKNGKQFLDIPDEFKLDVMIKNKQFKYDDGLQGIIENYLQDKEYTCIQEIYNELLKPLDQWKYNRTLSNKILEIIIRLDGWQKYTGSKDHKKNFTKYGKQLAFENYAKFEEIENRKKQAKEDYENRRKAETAENINNVTGQNLKYEDYFGKVGE